jgi:hypothetical protein
MPIRIKPSYDLGPCVLKLDGIKGIITRVIDEFPDARFNATDDVWEIFAEPSEVFLQNISQRKSLESFWVEAEKTNNDLLSLKIVLNKKEANVFLVASPKHQEWFEHFLIDIKKCLDKPDFSQVLAYGATSTGLDIVSFLAATISVTASVSTKANIKFSAPYCKIIIQPNQPSALAENIKANLISNVIWAALVFLAGVIVTLISTGRIRLP